MIGATASPDPGMCDRASPTRLFNILYDLLVSHYDIGEAWESFKDWVPPGLVSFSDIYSGSRICIDAPCALTIAAGMRTSWRSIPTAVQCHVRFAVSRVLSRSAISGANAMLH